MYECAISHRRALTGDHVRSTTDDRYTRHEVWVVRVSFQFEKSSRPQGNDVSGNFLFPQLSIPSRYLQLDLLKDFVADQVILFTSCLFEKMFVRANRTRDPKVLGTCDVVVDVGGVYDAQNHRYDHHQR